MDTNKKKNQDAGWEHGVLLNRERCFFDKENLMMREDYTSPIFVEMSPEIG